MTQWNEDEHPRDKDGKFTNKNGGSYTGGTASIDNIDDEMQKRAEILFPNTQVSQAQKYFDIRKETNPIKQYENIGLGNFEQSLQNKRNEVVGKSGKNTKNEQLYKICHIINPNRQNNSAIDIFCNNLADMTNDNTKNNDKYFHSKANCQSAQNGYITGALGLSLGKEIYDYFKKIYNGKKPREVIQDSYGDLQADFYGLGQGLLHPSNTCSDLVKRYRVDGIKEKY